MPKNMSEKLLTFELASKDEIEIHLDQEGIQELIQILTKLQKSNKPNHNHLMTSAWGGNELTSEKQAAANELINKVTIRLWG